MYPIHHFHSVESTNIIARELADERAVHGTSVVADFQTSGRGRLGKAWYSVSGMGLYCSIIVRPELEMSDYPKITMVAGLAAAVVLDRLTGLRTGLKWPNDIFYSECKCGGILCESSPLGSSLRSEKYAVVGIGINLNQNLEDFPEELRSSVTSLYRETGRRFEAMALMESFRDELLKSLDLFEVGGFTPLLARWRDRDILLGRQLDWVSAKGEVVRGVSLGPDDEGRLHVRDQGGAVHEVVSGDIRLAGRI